MGYNEYKLAVPHESLLDVKTLLDQQFGGSDPYSVGIVDSIYYDNIRGTLYDNCLSGEYRKLKFRIRGYGNNTFSQIHLKSKDVYQVDKIKAPIEPISCKGFDFPMWMSLKPKSKEAYSKFTEVIATSALLGRMVPVVRVKYKRYRYRVEDYRVTLDTNIEITGYNREGIHGFNYCVLPNHVLEVKTYSNDLRLPILRIIKLRQTSFSKFFLGLSALQAQDSAYIDR